MIGEETVPAAAKVVAVVTAAEAGMKVLEAPDPMLFGLLPEPLFYAALFGAAFGVFFMQDRVAERMARLPGVTVTGQVLGVLLKMAFLGVLVLGFAGLSAAMATMVLDYLTDGPGVKSTPGWIGVSIILGFFILPLLNKLQGGLERAIDATVDAYERVIGSRR